MGTDSAIAYRQRKEECAAAGVCIKCRRPNDSGGKSASCLECRARKLDRQRKSRASRTEEQKAADRSKLSARYKELAQAGLCRHCGQSSAMQQVRSCFRCWLKCSGRNNLGVGTEEMALFLEELLVRQGGLCPYTGEVLIPGVNMTLDHIYPVSRFPEKSLDPQNVQWVSEEANKAKAGFTDEEFRWLCVRVVAHQSLSPIDRSGMTYPPSRGGFIKRKRAWAQGRIVP